MNKIVKGFHEIYQEYDAFIFDLWGVLYEGGPIFPEALNTLKQLHSLKKSVILISNSPFLSKDCRANLVECGLSEELYKEVLTAGDLCMQYLQAHLVEPQKFYVIDKNYWPAWKTFNPLHTQTENIEEADAILCLAVPSEVALPEEVAPYFDHVFTQAINRGLKLICANPDLFAFCSQKMRLRPGLLSLRYKQLGGEVLSFGKPFPAIFEQGLKILGYPKRVLMTGDTEYTDIQGAARHNIDTLLITQRNKDTPLRSQSTYFMEQVKW